MKKSFLILIIASVLIVSVVAIVVAVKPSSTTIEFHQAQYKWRANSEYPSWSGHDYQDLPTISAEFRKTGNSLHTSWEYGPYVENEEGISTVYVFNKKTGYWVEKEGGVTYNNEDLYCDYTVNNFFKGYLDFGMNNPSSESFNQGVAYQWIYIYALENDTGVKQCLSFAQWDEEMGAWLVGFSLYLWDDSEELPEKPKFPDLLGEVKPLSGKEFNPLDL